MTATATDISGNSSEFAPSSELAAAPEMVRGGETMEGSGGLRTATFEVSVSGAINPPVYFRTLNGSALQGIDFVATNGVLQFTEETTSQVVVVSIIGDVLDETNETFFLEVSTATSLMRAASAILDDDSDTLAITQQPQSHTVRSGTNVTFWVSVASSTPVTYQWQFKGADIPGATSSNLTIANVQFSNNGPYSVRLSNNAGTYQSDPANLLVLVSPRMIQDPLSQSIVAGAAVTFSASVAGNPSSFTYEWRKLNTPVKWELSNETNTFLTLANFTTNEAGLYRVIVRNQANTIGISSRSATLTVLSDSDGDGMPDVWESAHSLDDPDDDADDDRLKNAQEYAAGTDPNDPSSTLRIDQIATDGGARLWFNAASNKTYTVDFRDNLESPWLRLTDVVARPTNYTAAVHDGITAAGRVYRVVTPWQP